MVYLLGGPPRVGKSIVSATIVKRHGISAVSTDSLGAVLENALDARTAPGLFVCARLDEMALPDRIRLMAENTSQRIEWQVEEARATWMAVPPFIQREKEEGRDVLIEGVAVLPQLVSQLEDPDCRAVFVGNQGDNVEENIRRSVEENENDWMRGAGDDYVNAFGIFVRQMSRYIEQEARDRGFAYVEMGGMPFGDAVEAVVESLVEPSG
jgi:2-phosphoglycerate kinase